MNSGEEARTYSSTAIVITVMVVIAALLIAYFMFMGGPIDNDGDENKPVYRTYVGGCEAGGGWNRVSRDGNDYIAVQIDGPELPGPIYANLITSTDPETGEARYFLMWNRKKDD